MYRIWLKYIVLTWGFAAVVLLVAGCSVNKAFVSAVDSAWEVVGPEYVEYVGNDAALDADTKATRLRTARLLTETIEAAK